MSLPSEPGAALTADIIGAAIEVHRHLGPGLLESVYQDSLCVELRLRNVPFEREVTFPVIYKGHQIGSRHRIDILVSRSVVLELKSIERVLPVHHAQLLSELRGQASRSAS